MRKLEEQMKTLGTARWLSSPTLLQFISGPGEVANDYNALESIHAPRGQFQKLEVLFIERTVEHHTLLSLDASHAIPPRVLCFGPSRSRASHPVRPPHLGGLTTPPGLTAPPGWLDRPGRRYASSSLRTWLSAQPWNLQWFCGEPLVKPRRRCSTSMPSFEPQVFRFRRTDRLLDLALFLDLVAAIIPSR